jgi:Raf kinase inhibitor-like YbhB/YbcL family protein
MPVASVLALLVPAGTAFAQDARPGVFVLESASIRDGGPIALKHAGRSQQNPNCLGQNVSPQLTWRNLPEGTRSVAITMLDVDGRAGAGNLHWIAYGIAPTVTSFAEDELGQPSDKYVAGAGSRPAGTYAGPCPGANSAPHHYVFTAIASDLEPNALPPGLNREELLARLQGHGKAASSIVGVFAHPDAPIQPE